MSDSGGPYASYDDEWLYDMRRECQAEIDNPPPYNIQQSESRQHAYEREMKNWQMFEDINAEIRYRQTHKP
jgi:hypothetical protein